MRTTLQVIQVCTLSWSRYILNTVIYNICFSAPSSYLQAAQTGVEATSDTTPPVAEKDMPMLEGLGDQKELCPFAAHGECRYGDNCVYIHGDLCDLCGHALLHPTDQKQRDKHLEVRSAINLICLPWLLCGETYCF